MMIFNSREWPSGRIWRAVAEPRLDPDLLADAGAGHGTNPRRSISALSSQTATGAAFRAVGEGPGLLTRKK
jgi:hypothetical protein